MSGEHRKGFIMHFAPKVSEWVTAIILLNWSVIVIYASEVTPQYLYQDFTNIKAWATIFGVVSFFRVMILYINGALRRSPHLRSGLAFISCFAWLQISLAFVSLETPTTALAVYPVLFALDFYNAYRIAVEARITDESFNNAAGHVTDRSE